MKKLILALSLFLNSCTSTPPLSMKPVDARIPELQFYYYKSGAWELARGQAADYFSPGDPKKFKVITHPKSGDCMINFVDGDVQKTFPCTNNSETIIDLGIYTVISPSVQAMSVVSENFGIQLGYFYPNLHSPKNMMGVEFTCPYSETNGNISVCTRPATYAFEFSFKIPTPGKLQVISQCTGGVPNIDTQTVTIPQEFKSKISSPEKNYCIVSINFVDNNNEQFQHIIHIRFYDPLYIPLSTPSVKLDDQGYHICTGEKYYKTLVNGEDYGVLGAGYCYVVNTPNVSIIGWDTIGRVAWGYASKEVSVLENGFNFYSEAYQFAQNKLSFCNDCDCVKQNVNLVLYDPKMINAVHDWNAKELY